MPRYIATPAAGTQAKRIRRAVEKGRESEHDIQSLLIAWARTYQHAYPELVPLWATPNGAKLTYRKNASGQRYSPEANKLVAEGLLSGVPDIQLAQARGEYHGLFLEMKKPGGRVSDEQKKMIALLRGNGYRVEVCYSTREAAAVIVEYLSLPAHILEGL